MNIISITNLISDRAVLDVAFNSQHSQQLLLALFKHMTNFKPGEKTFVTKSIEALTFNGDCTGLLFVFQPWIHAEIELSVAEHRQFTHYVDRAFDLVDQINTIMASLSTTPDFAWLSGAPDHSKNRLIYLQSQMIEKPFYQWVGPQLHCCLC